MAKSYSQVNFRIPTELKERIEKAAITHQQSVTAELVARLEQSFTQAQTPSDREKMLEEKVNLSLLHLKMLGEMIQGLKDHENIEFFHDRVRRQSEANSKFKEKYGESFGEEEPEVDASKPKTKDSGTW